MALMDIDWFKKNIVPDLKGFEIEYKFYENGDFGPLNQVEFNSDNIGGNIDFWGQGWLGVYLFNYIMEKELINILLEPAEEDKKGQVFSDFRKIIAETN